jgi:hypothetical protein
LPALIHRVRFHGRATLAEVAGFTIADNEAVRAQKERVISPARFAERGKHLRPNLCVAGLIFFDFFRADLEQKAGAHRVPFHL